MEKAYDFGEFAKRLKEQGLIAAEDLAGGVYMELKKWLSESAALSENKLDDIAIPFLNQLDPIVLPQIDKIDGKEG